jgi:hypothetical protein
MGDPLRARWLVSFGTVAVAVMSSASAAHAQTDNRLAVGLSLTSRLANSSDASGSADVGFELRIGHKQEGWGQQYSLFNWFDTGIQPVLPQTMAVGTLRVRPIMAGYGYTRIRGRTAFTVDVVGGYSLNSFELAPAALAEYVQRTGATGVASEATNALALKPEVQIWYDINSRFGLKLNGGYLLARPSVVIRSSLGEDVRSVRADTFLITVGLVYSLR